MGMRLLNEKQERWYCYKDDQLWLGKEERWVFFPNPIRRLSQKLQGHEIDGLRREVDGLEQAGAAQTTRRTP